MNEATFYPKNLKASGTSMHTGDTVRVKTTVMESGKSRIQIFEGILISLKGRGENKTFTVRRLGARGIGVERTWPLDSKSIVEIEVRKKAEKVRRSKLYYLRGRTGHSFFKV